MSPEQLALVAEDGRNVTGLEEPAAQPTTALTLMERAIDKGVPVEVLSQLMDLQERVEARNARMAYFDALNAFQDECPEIPKSKTAEIRPRDQSKPGFKYKYAPLDVIARTIRPHLRAHGLAYSFTVEEDTDKRIHVVCVLRHVDGHSERATFPVPVDASGRLSDAQANGAALTYGKRQTLVAVLGLTTTEDDIDARPGKERTNTITKEQVRTLSDMLEGMDVEGFLAWLGGVDEQDRPRYGKLADILTTDYKRAVAAIEEKRNAAGAR